ncbi:S8 family serine peptidase [Myroides pelagicus]|uniref:S8 family serine peptidase n=1 Tax=Myroides pelagicus TaxID=270914 RepID=A0A7K1GN30_9FLAO|nr:S8 family serine peptidase [Myroides pelagicus]MTH30285.1 S8 family serine peptidase [Myroides pelagicus]
MKLKLFSIFLLSLCVISCDKEFDSREVPNQENLEKLKQGVKGMITVEFQGSIVEQLDNTVNELTYPTGHASVDKYLQSVGGYKLKRVFPYAGKYESKQVQENLHAWYTVLLSEDAQKPKFQTLSNDNYRDVVAYVEPVYEPVLGSYTIVPTEEKVVSQSNSSAFFNDPLFDKQWNYLNDGTVGNYQVGDEYIVSSIAGADINMIPAWKQQTGKSEVIVCVVDGGIDIYHEDLKDNLWVNQGEIPGNGIDDDNNGYIDDVYGYNFVDETGEIEPHDHGTHVAGVIAATNNNGKGISSIAGGDGTPLSGVRVMSSQIFKANPNHDPNDPDSPRNISVKSSNHTAAAIVYGANNGAIISQNSWGYNVGLSTPRVVQVAIDYFIKNAGYKHTKEPLIEGGLVVFSASNDNTSYKTYPGAEPNVIAVAAYAPDFSASWYTNYGTWVDITAPGGSSKIGKKYPYQGGKMTSGILSTVVSEHGQGKYGYMQGTSMASPHVSGIASLIVSKYGGQGYTNRELKQKLLTSVKGVDANNYNVKEYHDKLGKGYIDAHLALAEVDYTALPGIPYFMSESIERSYKSITIAWKAHKAANQEQLNIESYTLYVSSQPITSANLNSEQVIALEVPASYNVEDALLERKITGLSSGTQYFFALRSYARNGKASELVAYQQGITTLTNRAPIIHMNIDDNLAVELAGNDVLELAFSIEEPEQQKWDYSLSNSAQLTHWRSKNDVIVKLEASKFYKGDHQIVLKVTDQYGARSERVFRFTKRFDNPPRLIESQSSLNVVLNSLKQVNLKQLINDEEVESLQFELETATSSVYTAGLNQGVLTIKPKQQGKGEIVLWVTDKHAQKTKVVLPVFVYANEGIYSLYPKVAEDIVYLKVGDSIHGEVQLTVRDVLGRQVKKEIFNTKELHALKRTYVLYVNSLSPGRYEVVLNQGNEQYKQSFVKQ